MIDKKELLFPFPSIRKSQNALLLEVEKAVKEKTNLLVHAPTGIGKTVATLSPSLAYALKEKKTIFFLTSRHTQHIIALETLKQIKNIYQIQFQVVDLIGKKNLCLFTDTSKTSNSEFIEYCRIVRERDECDFFLNLKTKGFLSNATKQTLSYFKNIMNVQEVMEICKKTRVCPYEILHLAAKNAHVIICDYSHLLNPMIRDSLLKRTGKELKDIIVILDEAHNLPDRCRELLTNSLSTLTIERAMTEAKHNNFIHESLFNIKKLFEEFAQEMEIYEKETLIAKEELLAHIKDHENLIKMLNILGESVIAEKKRSSSKSAADFLSAWKGPDDGFVRILKKGFSKKGKPIITLNYKCLDPSFALQPILENVHNIIAMSGTLKPTEMYQDLLGFKKAVKREYKNPFPQENKITLIVPGVTTKFTKRNVEMYEKIATYCASLVNSIQGNTIIFFPSYELRDNINIYFEKQCKKTTFFEQKELTKEEKENLLVRFKAYKEKGAVLLAIAKANFGESIDLPGDLLKAVIVVGLPLSPPDLETKALIQYYQEKFERGMDYGYLMPAIIQILQNAGRCIRSETDKGVIVFLEERLNSEYYQRLLPEDNYIITNAPEEKVKEFFENQK